MKPTIGFVVTVPDKSRDYWLTTVLNTVASVDSQLTVNFHVVVARPKGLPDLPYPVTPEVVTYIDTEDTECDPDFQRASQYVRGMKALQDVDYILHVPAGTFVSEQLALVIGEVKPSEVPGWEIPRGVCFNSQGSRIVPWWHAKSHASVIVRRDLLLREVLHWPDNFSEDTLGNGVHPYIFRVLFQSKGKVVQYFAELGETFLTWEDEIAVGEWLPEGESVQEKFDRLHPPRWMYELNPPVCNHLQQEIGIHVGDAYCDSHLDKLGCGNVFRLGARQLHAILDGEIWSKYKKVAHIRNPWAYVWCKFCESGEGSLQDFVERNPPMLQYKNIFLPNGDGPNLIIWDVEGEDKDYKPHYNDVTRELVRVMYRKDALDLGTIFTYA